MSTRLISNILLIEDNPGDAHLIKVHLKDSSVKHELYIAESFFDGMDYIKEKEIDLVLLDLTLPDSSGFKTLTNFIEKVPNIPVVVLTGVNNEIVGNQSVKAGAQDFLVKGQFDGKLLGRVIRYSLQRFKTQLKLEETAQSLAISEKRYVEAQEMAKFGNWEMDIVSNSMKWTDEIFRIFGHNPRSFNPTLSEYINYVHLEDKAEVEDFFENAAKDGQLHRMEHRIIIDGRTIKYISIQAKVYYEEINQKILLVGAIQDITERKLTEQLIIEKNITQKASKVKEEALADMGFHIRTPLSSVVNLLFLLENTNITSQQKEYMDGLKTSVDDLSIMIHNMLNFSVLVSEKIKVEEEEFKIHDLLQSIQKVVQIKTDNSKLDLHFEIDDQFPQKLISDHNKLTQIFYNLIDHIIKHSSEDHKIAIQAKSKEIGVNQIEFCLSVQNNGFHISQEKIDEILESDKLLEVYDEHEQMEKQKLGLAIVTKLVKTLNGRLEVESSATKGTTFMIKMPIKVAKQKVLQLNGKPEAPIKILLVEDHFLNQIATKKVLTTWSSFVSVDIAENGLIGVEKFREHGYDLVLMDMQMPVMGGIEAAKKIREKSNVPIISLTANSSKQEADKCYTVGINDYMAKPFKPQELYAKIMSLLVAVES